MNKNPNEKKEEDIIMIRLIEIRIRTLPPFAKQTQSQIKNG